MIRPIQLAESLNSLKPRFRTIRYKGGLNIRLAAFTTARVAAQFEGDQG